MKTIKFITLIALVAALLSSCTASKWYGRSHDGCQSAQGMVGYGNK